MTDDRHFPVLWPCRRDEIARHTDLGCPRSVPWSLVEPHAQQAERNHGGQSLSRLAERGGLCPSELCAVLEDRPWRSMDDGAAVRLLREYVARYA